MQHKWTQEWVAPTHGIEFTWKCSYKHTQFVRRKGDKKKRWVGLHNIKQKTNIQYESSVKGYISNNRCPKKCTFLKSRKYVKVQQGY